MKTTLAGILLFALFIGSIDDCQETKNEGDLYCEMVRDGLWPNYKSIECEVDNEKNSN